MLKQIVDGFAYNPNLLYLACRYWPNALAQLDPLRRAKNYRPRWFVAPLSGESIDPFDTLFCQFQVSEGSWFWGYNFSGGDDNAGTFYVQMTDSCTQEPLFRDYVNGAGLSPTRSSRCVPIILSQPRPVVGSGKFDVSICNTSSTTATCQLLLHFAEPCQMVDEKTGAVITGGR
jgi:hypothetical protein